MAPEPVPSSRFGPSEPAQTCIVYVFSDDTSSVNEWRIHLWEILVHGLDARPQSFQALA